MAEAKQAERQPEMAQTSSEREQSILVNPPEEPKKQEEEAPDFQKVADRLGNQVGELRKENKHLQEQLQAFIDKQSQPEPEPDVSWEEDPGKFIEQKMAKLLEERIGPKMQVLESDLQRRISGEFEQQMEEASPGWEEVVKSDDFGQWVQANPGMRYLVERAATQYDIQAGIEAIRRFKQDQQSEAAKRRGAFEAATMNTGGSGDGSARIYAASEIQHMKLTDPEAYRRWLAADGYQAYREGRVKRR